MVYLLHGDDITASRRRLNELLEGKSHVERFDARKNSLNEILLALKSTGLFLDEKTVVIENINKFSPKQMTELSENLTIVAKQKEMNVYIWHDDVLTSPQLQKFKVFDVMLFPLPKYFFQFLDSYIPGQKILLHSLLSKLSNQFAPEQILFALLKRIRQLLILSTSSHHEFGEFTKMAPWQLTKLQRQAAKWDQKQLVRMYKMLFELEIGQKTSALSSSLLNSLDILLVTEL